MQSKKIGTWPRGKICRCSLQLHKVSLSMHWKELFKRIVYFFGGFVKVTGRGERGGGGKGGGGRGGGGLLTSVRLAAV